MNKQVETQSTPFNIMHLCWIMTLLCFVISFLYWSGFFSLLLPGSKVSPAQAGSTNLLTMTIAYTLMLLSLVCVFAGWVKSRRPAVQSSSRNGFSGNGFRGWLPLAPVLLGILGSLLVWGGLRMGLPPLPVWKPLVLHHFPQSLVLLPVLLGNAVGFILFPFVIKRA